MAKKRAKAITAEEFDQRFDEGESIDVLADIDIVSRRILVEFPHWMLELLDGDATRLGIPRQAVIKTIIDQHYAEKKYKKGV